MTYTPPVLGAALAVPFIEQYRQWLLEKPRDLEIQSFHDPKILMGDWSSLVNEAKKLIDGLEGRIGIHGPFVGFSLKTPDPEIQEIVKKRLDQGLEICRELGATNMVVHSPYTYWDFNNLDNYPGKRDHLYENCHATMNEAIKKAEDIGCTIVIENIEDIDPDDRKGLVESFNSEAVAISIDTGHAHYAHCTYNAPPVDYFVKSAGNKLAHVHIQDVDGYADRHWAPGEGTLPWHAFFRAIHSLDTKPRLVLELADANKVASGAQWLQQQGLTQ